MPSAVSRCVGVLDGAVARDADEQRPVVPAAVGERRVCRVHNAVPDGGELVVERVALSAALVRSSTSSMVEVLCERGCWRGRSP